MSKLTNKQPPKRQETPAEGEEKTRRCLSCGEKFLSLWSGNRICKRCKATSVWRQGA